MGYDAVPQFRIVDGSFVAVVDFLIAEHRRTTGALLEANTRLANAVEQQGKALEGVRALLASQGYTLPPLAKPQ